MESIKINTNSWHYKLLAHFYGRVSAEDICEYRTNLIKAILASAIITFLGFFGVGRFCNSCLLCLRIDDSFHFGRGLA